MAENGGVQCAVVRFGEEGRPLVFIPKKTLTKTGGGSAAVTIVSTKGSRLVAVATWTLISS